MKSRFIALSCGVALCGALFAVEEKEETSGWAYNPGEGVSFDEQPIVSAEFELAFDSKYMSYGLVDNNDPIITPYAGLTFFDWVYFGVSAIYDITRYGERAGYYDRRWSHSEIDPEVGISHSFSGEDFEWLPTTVDLSVSYLYESHPYGRNAPYVEGLDYCTQFVTFEVGLPNVWVEPILQYELDIDRDNGSYVNLELGHTFPIIDGETDEDDPVLSLKPSIAQGWGDYQRVCGYLSRPDGKPLERGGLMDTWLKLTADWNICKFLTLSGYVAYSDFLFDGHIREASREYEVTGDWEHSWNFTCGFALTATF